MYEVVTSATGLKIGQRVTEKEVNDLPGMGGVVRLASLGVIKPATGPAPEADPETPVGELATGAPPPLRDEPQHENPGTSEPGEHAPENPGGAPGEVRRGPGPARRTVR